MLGRTNVLRKRLKRMLAGLAGKVDRVEYQFTGSKLACQFLVWISRGNIWAGGIGTRYGCGFLLT